MKKVLFILVMTAFTLVSLANKSGFKAGSKSLEISDSVKVHIDYETNLLYLNFGDYHKRFFTFNTLEKEVFDNCVKFETVGICESDRIYVHLLFYSKGTSVIRVKDAKNGKVVQYSLN